MCNVPLKSQQFENCRYTKSRDAEKQGRQENRSKGRLGKDDGLTRLVLDVRLRPFVFQKG